MESGDKREGWLIEGKAASAARESRKKILPYAGPYDKFKGRKGLTGERAQERVKSARVLRAVLK